MDLKQTERDSFSERTETDFKTFSLNLCFKRESQPAVGFTQQLKWNSDELIINLHFGSLDRTVEILYILHT